MIADKDEHIKTILSVIPEEPKTTGILLFQQGT